MPMQRARSVAALEAVLARDRQRERREEPIDVGDAPAGDQRGRAAGRAVARAAASTVASIGRVGRVGDVQQRAVDVEEQRDLARGGDHARGIDLGRAARGRAGHRGATFPRAAAGRPSRRHAR
jgi:hypothetical protein